MLFKLRVYLYVLCLCMYTYVLLIFFSSAEHHHHTESGLFLFMFHLDFQISMHISVCALSHHICDYRMSLFVYMSSFSFDFFTSVSLIAPCNGNCRIKTICRQLDSFNWVEFNTHRWLKFFFFFFFSQLGTGKEIATEEEILWTWRIDIYLSICWMVDTMRWENAFAISSQIKHMLVHWSVFCGLIPKKNVTAWVALILIRRLPLICIDIPRMRPFTALFIE